VFAIIDDLKNAGVTVKALMATGYGGDLVTGGPGAVQTAQGVYFSAPFEPVEMKTAATQQLQSDLKQYAGVSTDPTFAEYQGYVSMDAFVQGLKAAGSNPTQASLINALLGMTAYKGAGLWGTHTLSFAMADRGKQSGVDNCWWITQFQGQTFHVLSGMAPALRQGPTGLGPLALALRALWRAAAGKTPCRRPEPFRTACTRMGPFGATKGEPGRHPKCYWPVTSSVQAALGVLCSPWCGLSVLLPG
jgi:hypothetical protein